MIDMRGRSAMRLRRVVTADGLTSGVAGLGLAAAPGSVAALVGAPSASLVFWVGVGLIAFGLALILNARRPVPSRGETILIAMLNLAWVAGSAVVVAAGALNPLGRWALVIVGIVVLGFAVLELRLLPAPERPDRTLDAARA
jgi:hypothetical protein